MPLICNLVVYTSSKAQLTNSQQQWYRSLSNEVICLRSLVAATIGELNIMLL